MASIEMGKGFITDSAMFDPHKEDYHQTQILNTANILRLTLLVSWRFR